MPRSVCTPLAVLLFLATGSFGALAPRSSPGGNPQCFTCPRFNTNRESILGSQVPDGTHTLVCAYFSGTCSYSTADGSPIQQLPVPTYCSSASISAEPVVCPIYIDVYDTNKVVATSVDLGHVLICVGGIPGTACTYDIPSKSVLGPTGTGVQCPSSLVSCSASMSRRRSKSEDNFSAMKRQKQAWAAARRDSSASSPARAMAFTLRRHALER